MVPAPCPATASVPPPSSHRAVAKRTPAGHRAAVIVITRLHGPTSRFRAGSRGAPQVPASPGPTGPAPRTYSAERLLLLALVRTLWRLG
jgi:hypothetical protein